MFPKSISGENWHYSFGELTFLHQVGTTTGSFGTHIYIHINKLGLTFESAMYNFYSVSVTNYKVVGEATGFFEMLELMMPIYTAISLQNFVSLSFRISCL